MLFEYVQKGLERAQYKNLDDGTWFAEIPGFEGFGLMRERLKNVGASSWKFWRNGSF